MEIREEPCRRNKLGPDLVKFTTYSWGNVIICFTVEYDGLTAWDMLWIQQLVIDDASNSSSLKSSMWWFYDSVVDPVRSAVVGNDSTSHPGPMFGT